MKEYDDGIQEAYETMDEIKKIGKSGIKITDEEEGLIALSINQFGNGEHPWAEAKYIDGFDIDYIIDVLNKAIKKYPSSPKTKKAKILLQKLEKK